MNQPKKKKKPLNNASKAPVVLKLISFAIALILLVAFLVPGRTLAASDYGLSLYGPAGLKLGPDEPWPYVNPSAPKGGHLAMRTQNFTTLNPVALKGIGAPLLDLVFESAMTASFADNEAFSQYGHLVESVEIAEDRLSLVYRIRPEARFSDGHPVTADDFVFSFEITKHPEFNPVYKQYFADIVKVEKIDGRTVRYHFARRNQELPLITGQMTILPKHVYGAAGKDFGRDFDTLAVGSGPYVVDRFEFGKYITVRRNPQWWARELPKSQGCHNFDTITSNVFLDDTSMKESFKGGAFDVMLVSVSKDWALDFHGPFIQKNYIQRREIQHDRPVGMQGFSFNLRRDIFKSHKTRYAIALVFDFPWANRNLFYSQYNRTRCFFENSPDLTHVAPPSGRMLDYLGELRDRHGAEAVPKMALSEPLHAPGQGQSPLLSMRQAEILLDAAGWKRGSDGVRVRSDGRRLEFSVLLLDQHWQRITEPYQARLRELGAALKTEVLQPAEYQQRVRAFDFDMIVGLYSHSRSIGNELLYFFSSEAADVEGSRNVNGLRNPAVDEIVGRIVEAETREELVFYGQALDRILTSSTIVVPHWHLTYDRTLVWNKFGQPERHCSQQFFETVVRDYWWFDAARARSLQEARQAGGDLP